jgi:hypothetical protein
MSAVRGNYIGILSKMFGHALGVQYNSESDLSPLKLKLT